jgi:membrane-associated phospholipid phosphatase
MLALADFIARHALVVLSIVALAWLLLVAAFWHFIHRYGEMYWTWAVRGWDAWRRTKLVQQIKGVPVLGPFLSHAMSVVRYLGLYAIASFAIAIVAIIAFVELADEIGIDESLATFDEALARSLAQQVSYDVLRAFSIVTVLGDPTVLIVIATVVAVALLLWRRWLLAGAWIVSTAGGALLNVLLKQLFERPRPIHNHGLVTETSFSFPSGHASGSMLVYSLLAYLIVRHTPKQWHVPVTVAMSALIVFVGSSRVILQVHYFSDVLAGYASAAAWAALCIAGLEAMRWREEHAQSDPDR